jgi:hypothetical protein
VSAPYSVLVYVYNSTLTLVCQAVCLYSVLAIAELFYEPTDCIDHHCCYGYDGQGFYDPNHFTSPHPDPAALPSIVQQLPQLTAGVLTIRSAQLTLTLALGPLH